LHPFLVVLHLKFFFPHHFTLPTPCCNT
jgi:hypothetical protein